MIEAQFPFPPGKNKIEKSAEVDIVLHPGA
jgi:hypothetical protein